MLDVTLSVVVELLDLFRKGEAVGQASPRRANEPSRKNKLGRKLRSLSANVNFDCK
jgi:hypothetical protein